MKVRGKWLMIRIDGRTVALATNCAIDVVLQTIDARTKSDAGAYEVADYISFTMNSESVVGMTDDTQVTHAVLMEMMHRKQPVDVEVMIAANATLGKPAGRDWTPGPTAEKGFRGYGGRALIKQLTINAATDGNATMTVQLSGIGELEPQSTTEVSARVEGSTLYIEGSAEVLNGLRVEGDVVINDNKLEL